MTPGHAKKLVNTYGGKRRSQGHIQPEDSVDDLDCVFKEIYSCMLFIQLQEQSFKAANNLITSLTFMLQQAHKLHSAAFANIMNVLAHIKENHNTKAAMEVGRKFPITGNVFKLVLDSDDAIVVLDSPNKLENILHLGPFTSSNEFQQGFMRRTEQSGLQDKGVQQVQSDCYKGAVGNQIGILATYPLGPELMFAALALFPLICIQQGVGYIFLVGAAVTYCCASGNCSKPNLLCIQGSNSTLSSCKLMSIRYYFLHSGLQKRDLFFGDPQQTYTHLASKADPFLVNVLLEAKRRYRVILVHNGVKKFSILWHRSWMNPQYHYTLQGYNTLCFEQSIFLTLWIMLRLATGAVIAIEAIYTILPSTQTHPESPCSEDGLIFVRLILFNYNPISPSML
ncbi:hypothetical protein EDD18DRAFT_1104600 [Armillaria luteobubalina]|uniref:Uncharacterized protein n=1 Tax=Armillaria luteobubalina TaxID=153913 RepID=A0AA39Q6X8_9AGAR|nr:hypothetical protein EDD18DRAFT_1104600 [Armillaria luteobubalina]